MKPMFIKSKRDIFNYSFKSGPKSIFFCHADYFVFGLNNFAVN